MLTHIGNRTDPVAAKTIVTIEGETGDEINSAEAKKLAMAQSGFSRPGFSNQSGMYPVDQDGNMLNPTQAVPPGVSLRFRQDFEINGGS